MQDLSAYIQGWRKQLNENWKLVITAASLLSLIFIIVVWTSPSNNPLIPNEYMKGSLLEPVDNRASLPDTVRLVLYGGIMITVAMMAYLYSRNYEMFLEWFNKIQLMLKNFINLSTTTSTESFFTCVLDSFLIVGPVPLPW